MPQTTEWKELAKRLSCLFEKPEEPADEASIRATLGDAPAPTIALALDELSIEQAQQVFDALEKPCAGEVLAKLAPERVKQIVRGLEPEELPELVEPLPPREAAAVITEAPKKEVEELVENGAMEAPARKDVQQKISYRKGTAGRLMTTQYVRLHDDMTVADALNAVKQTDPNMDIPNNLYVVDRNPTGGSERQKLLGAISIRTLLMCPPDKAIREVMATDPVSVQADTSDREAAALLSTYKFMSLPVTDGAGHLLGVIPADDLLPVLVGRLRLLYNHAVGTDAERMERLTPFQEARLRLPWLLGTMAIEICSGMVISHFDDVLKKIILLASFMPVISAISGNVGLQAAAITVRAVDSKTRRRLWPALRKELATSLLMAAACGLVLGTVGGIWAQHLPFGLLIGVALTCSMITAGFMGTVIPIVSKHLGFDPATTAGPFETAFQDIVGFGVFLWLATMFQYWIS